MNSPFAKLYLSIMARVLAEVPEIRYIDQELGQLESYPDGGRPAVSWPCLLIDVDTFSFAEMLEQAQSGEGAVILRLGFPAFSSTSNLTPQTYRETALSFYDIEHNIFKALHGWCPDADNPPAKGGYGSLIRVSAATEQRPDGIRVRVLRFSIGMEDYLAERPYILIKGDYSRKSYDQFDYETGPRLKVVEPS